MEWLVDGNNVIRRDPELADAEGEGGLAAGRTALCHRLANAAQRTRDRFVVVFDGAKGGGQAPGGFGVSVIFSPARQSADVLLIERARPGTTVVSDDRDVADRAQRAGAATLSVKDFIARVRGRRPR